MKFLCDQCKAKYQIPDEKIAGRNLRMKCRKCSHEIIIRGPKSPESLSPRASSRASRRGGSGATSRPAPPRSTAPRSALGADFRRGGALAEAPVPKAAAVEWYVAINDVPVGPIKREEVARKIGMGAVSAASLCWREGLDDWRPVGEVPELATLLEQRRVPAPPPPKAAQKQRPAPPPPVATPSPANVIPIGGRMGPAPADFDDDDKTVMTSSPFADGPSDDSEPAIAPIVAPVPPVAAPPAAVPPVAAPLATPPVAAPLAGAEASPAVPVSAAANASAADSSAAFAAPPTPLAVPMEEPPRKKGMAPGVMMGIAGAACFGIVFAIMAAQRLLPSDTPVVAVTDLDPTQEGPVVAEPDIEIPDELTEAPDPEEPTTDDSTDPEATEATEDDPEGETSPATNSTAMTTTRAPTTDSTSMTLSAEQAELLERFGGGTNDPDISMVTLAMDTTANRTQLEDSAVRRVVNASANRTMLQRCYNTAIRGHGDPPNLRVDINIRVAASGRVTSATATGGNLGQLKSCLETSVKRWVFPQSSAGGQASFPVVFSAG